MDNTTPNPLNTGNGQTTPSEPVSAFKLNQDVQPTAAPRQITNDELQKSASVDLQVTPAPAAPVTPVAPVQTPVEPTPPTPPVTPVDPDQKLAAELQNIDEPKAGFTSFMQNPNMKKYLMIGGAALVFIAIVLGVYFTFFSGDEAVAEETTTEENTLGNSLSDDEVEDVDPDAERLENVVNELKELNEEDSDTPPGMSIVIPDESVETEAEVDTTEETPAKVMR